MKIAAVQTSPQAGERRADNDLQVRELVREAIGRRARLICLPECFNFRGPVQDLKQMERLSEEIPGPSTRPLISLAKTHRVYILAGSVFEKVPGQRKAYNTSIVIDPRGQIVARYRKIHLFTARIGPRSIREEDLFLPGRTGAAARIGTVKMGLSLCYDLRFPRLYEGYRRQGCQLLAVPSAFTRRTGEAHWEILLRARAIENLSYVVAPNQAGPSSAVTYGHSMIVGPWGEVLARASANRPEVITATVDQKAVGKAMAILPGIR